MSPDLLVHTLKGMLRNGEYESTCDVMQRVAGQGQATYYINARIVDSSVSPHLEDGDYVFGYVGEGQQPEPATRQSGIWLNVPPSTRKPPAS